MEEWTSRERVLAAIEHKEADRIPISFGGTMATGMLECPPDGKNYTKLCQYLEIEDYQEPDTGFAFNYVGNIDERILQRFTSDFRRVDANPPEIRIESDGTKTVMGTGCGMRIKKMGYYDDIFEFPLGNCESKKDIEQYPFWPTAEDFRKMAEGKKEEAKNLRRSTNYAIVVDTLLWFPFLSYPLLTGYEKWFIDMKLNPKFYFALCDRLFEVGLGIVENFIGSVGDYIDIVATYDDMGNQEGLLCSHKDYVKFIKPYEKRMIEHIKKYTKAKIYRHSCGSVYEIIPDLIEIGVEILNPIQPLAKNMEPWRLKKEFGKDLTFCGGIDIQKLLPHGTPEEVREGVRKTIETYAPGGGYILGPSHNIEPDTPPENIVAMYEAAQEYGQYPIS